VIKFEDERSISMLDFCKRVIELKETTYVENPG
jgi:hypothetical protein